MRNSAQGEQLAALELLPSLLMPVQRPLKSEFVHGVKDYHELEHRVTSAHVLSVEWLSNPA